MRQDILQALKALGLPRLKQARDDIYAFDQKVRAYLFVYKRDNFVKICIPDAAKAEGLSELATCQLLDKINKVHQGILGG